MFRDFELLCMSNDLEAEDVLSECEFLVREDGACMGGVVWSPTAATCKLNAHELVTLHLATRHPQAKSVLGFLESLWRDNCWCASFGSAPARACPTLDRTLASPTSLKYKALMMRLCFAWSRNLVAMATASLCSLLNLANMPPSCCPSVSEKRKAFSAYWPFMRTRFAFREILQPSASDQPGQSHRSTTQSQHHCRICQMVSNEKKAQTHQQSRLTLLLAD